jgi:Protein of unknown function (DUF3168)
VSDRSVELFSAIFAALDSDTALTALIGAGHVHDHVPPGAPAPYVVMGDGTATDMGGSFVDAQEHTITVHAWAEGTSTLGVKRIVAAVRACLHERPLTLSAGGCTGIRCEFTETMRDPDGVSFHGVLRFRAVTTD